MTASDRDWIIEPARPGEEEGIAALIDATIEPLERRLTIFGCSGYVRYVGDWIRREPVGAETVYLVARREDVLLGFLELRRIGDAICVNNTATAEAARGQGVYRELIRAGLTYGADRGHRTAFHHVFEGNSVRGYHERLGYRFTEALAFRAIDLAEAPTPDPQATVGDLPQADCAHARHGFSRLTVRTPAGVYPVGRLGEEWFRVTDPAVLSDRDALGCLRRLDPARAILWIGNADLAAPPGVEAEVLLRSDRMEGSIPELLNGLDQRRGAR